LHGTVRSPPGHLKKAGSRTDPSTVLTSTFWLPGYGLDETLDSPSTLVLAFGHPDLTRNSVPVRMLREAYPSSVIVGCSTSGQIVDGAIVDEGLAGVVARFEHTRLRLSHTIVVGPDDSAAAGGRLAKELCADAQDAASLAAVLVLSDGVVVNGSDLVNGLNSRLPAGVSVSGGLAGDQARFSATWVLAGSEFGPSSVAAIGLYGDRVRTSYGSRGGWDRFGPCRVVTRSEGNKLYELDGKPALELYKSYLGTYADGLPGSALLFPLSVHSPDRATDAVRTILSVDEAEQSMTFAGDVPMGSATQLMRATHDMLIAGAGDAADECVAAADSSLPTVARSGSLALAVSCVGRRLVLGERAEEEVESVTGALGEVPLVGFYSNGELSPQDGFCDLLNQTMTLTIVSEV